MGFDIEKQKEAVLAEDEGVDVHIHDLSGTPVYYQTEEGEERPVTIRVAGAHSSHFRKAEEAIRRRKLKASSFTGEKLYEDNVFKVVQCTLGWDGFIQNGEMVPFTKEMARFIYLQLPWVYDQVVEAMHDHSRFFGNESSS